jgi:hypothetical protein
MLLAPGDTAAAQADDDEFPVRQNLCRDTLPLTRSV